MGLSGGLLIVKNTNSDRWSRPGLRVGVGQGKSGVGALNVGLLWKKGGGKCFTDLSGQGNQEVGGWAAGEEGGGGIVSLLVSWRPLPGLGGKKEWYSLKEEKGEFP